MDQWERLSSRQATPCSVGSRSKTRGRLLVSEWHLQIWTCLLQWRKAAKARRKVRERSKYHYLCEICTEHDHKRLLSQVAQPTFMQATRVCPINSWCICAISPSWFVTLAYDISLSSKVRWVYRRIKTIIIIVQSSPLVKWEIANT